MVQKIVIVALGVILWFVPHSDAIQPEAWQLFVIFITTILSVVFGIFSILPASILGMVTAVLTHTLSPQIAFSGFANDVVLLIIVTFLIAKAIVKSGLGSRIALLMISRFGKTSLGLGYSLIATDMIIAPAFPSNTARSGLLFPVVYSVAVANDSDPEAGTEKKLGSFLMFCSMMGIGLSSGLWLTAMAANPVGASIAKGFGVHIDFFSWVLAAVAPTLAAAVLLPWVLYKIYPPQIKHTPDAPGFALQKLREMGSMNRSEWITAGVFLFLVLGWALSETLHLNRTMIAFLGLGVLLFTNVFRAEDIRKEGEVLTTMIWFAILFTMSSALNDLGFMSYAGGLMAEQIASFSPSAALFLLVLIYVLLHYLFVSQTAHLMALFGVFMGAGATLGVNPTVLAFMLLFATNYFSIISPQGSSCNVLYISSGYIKPAEVYLYGGVLTFLSFVIYMAVGIGWLSLIS